MTVRQDQLAPAEGSKHKKKRVGRGLGSGHGTYSGRGLKGQKARSGGGVKPFFEGGQLPLIRRLPHKRGFNNIFKREYSTVNIAVLNIFPAETVVDRDELLKAGIINSGKLPVKILSTGDLSRPLTVRAEKFSAAAKEKIVAAGGRVEEVKDAAKAK